MGPADRHAGHPSPYTVHACCLCPQALQLGSNQIASIASLQLGSLNSLRTLFLNNNDITRIDGLEGLANLQVRTLGWELPIYSESPKMHKRRFHKQGTLPYLWRQHLTHSSCMSTHRLIFTLPLLQHHACCADSVTTLLIDGLISLASSLYTTKCCLFVAC